MNIKRALFLIAGLAISAGALANDWPARPVTIIVPFPAGGGTDAFARPLAAQLTKQLGKTVVIDNRGGAGGTLGAGLASRAAPDGYTFFMGGAHHAIAPSIYPKLDYDIQKDFIPVSLVATPPQVIVVNPQRVPVNDLKGLIEYAQKNPGKVNFGSAGNGTSHHLAGELFKIQTKTSLTHIPYKGAGPALQDLVAGQVDMMFDGLGSSASHIKAGKIKALAVAASKRAPGFPNVPTAAEAGLPDYEVSTWYGLFAVKGTPPELVERMRTEVKKALASSELQTNWQNGGSDIPTMSSSEFGAMVASEVARWNKVVKAANVKID
ncbi:Bug family tripartite tricarboxylate transporter substrate binding protein [Noviherbaspirillum sp. Root189]|uniref:Bug family tripartite tricarboxylate transporter substrate binding protein n=1 Tax=Noviherbaspirillum sp. Root189 TaxID=1736487 RepID=UPI000708B01A|nr:tripartite tricarboxylate transporter substrate binding protein [Noviherbaspirillum sp. Root189]KRB84009.1 ABC transporter substrate-binding protein [Noviherbaspirillum sp. Root189]